MPLLLFFHLSFFNSFVKFGLQQIHTHNIWIWIWWIDHFFLFWNSFFCWTTLVFGFQPVALLLALHCGSFRLLAYLKEVLLLSMFHYAGWKLINWRKTKHVLGKKSFLKNPLVARFFYSTFLIENLNSE